MTTAHHSTKNNTPKDIIRAKKLKHNKAKTILMKLTHRGRRQNVKWKRNYNIKTLTH